MPDTDGVNTQKIQVWLQSVNEKTHRVIKCENVTKQDDIVSQRHEKIGTERIYKYLEDQGIAVNVHIHD